MINGASWTLVSTGLRKGMVQWPGDTIFEINTETIKDNGIDINVSSITTSLHIGTHIDAPLHYITNGNDITKFNSEVLIGEVKVISIINENEITIEELKNKSINKGDRVFFKTTNSNKNWMYEPFKYDFIALSTDAAKYLAEKQITMVGIDYISIGRIENNNEVHAALLEKGICIVEGLLLRDIEVGNYELICLPLFIESAEGSPATVLLKKSN